MGVFGPDYETGERALYKDDQGKIFLMDIKYAQFHRCHGDFFPHWYFHGILSDVHKEEPGILITSKSGKAGIWNASSKNLERIAGTEIRVQ